MTTIGIVSWLLTIVFFIGLFLFNSLLLQVAWNKGVTNAVHGTRTITYPQAAASALGIVMIGILVKMPKTFKHTIHDVGIYMT